MLRRENISLRATYKFNLKVRDFLGTVDDDDDVDGELDMIALI